MAKAAARRLKVFQARFGFYDSVVAAPSQAAALRAWGVRQNLFADGEASITQDAHAVEAAVAHPETPLRRPVGSRAPFSLDPVGLPQLPDEPSRPKPAAANPVKAAPPESPAKPGPDRSCLAAAESALDALDTARRAEEANFRQRQQDLDAERQAAQKAYVDHRKAATDTLARARAAYRKAGGA